MATMRTTITLDVELAEQARQFDINLSAAARDGIREAVRVAAARSDRAAYLATPEVPDEFWDGAEAWADQ